MRDLAALAAIGLFLAAFYVIAAHGADTVRTARTEAAVTLTATR